AVTPASSLLTSRAMAVTWWPRLVASFSTRAPTPPVAPIRAIFMGLALPCLREPCRQSSTDDGPDARGPAPPGLGISPTASHISMMNYRPTSLERAVALARTGDYPSVADVSKQLKAEGYSDAQLTGPALTRQIREL